MAQFTQALAFTSAEAEPVAQTINPHAQRLAFTFAAAGDPPVIGNFSPAVGTPLARNDTVSFDVTDPTGLLRGEVFVVLGSDVLVVHDGDRFRGRFTNFSSRAAIVDGFRYTVRPNGGWTSAPTFEVHATDTDGNEAA